MGHYTYECMECRVETREAKTGRSVRLTEKVLCRPCCRRAVMTMEGTPRDERRFCSDCKPLGVERVAERVLASGTRVCDAHYRERMHLPPLAPPVRFTDKMEKPLSDYAEKRPEETMNTIDPAKRTEIVALLKGGASVRRAGMVAGVAKNTVMRVRQDIVSELPANCECGKPNGHKGWCKSRVAKSPARQAVVEKLTGKRYTGPDRRQRKTVEALLVKLQAQRAELDEKIKACEKVIEISDQVWG